jgi:hypothetical protein
MTTRAEDRSDWRDRSSELALTTTPILYIFLVTKVTFKIQRTTTVGWIILVVCQKTTMS